MSAQSDLIIEDMNNARDAAYNQIEDAINDLFGLGVPESAILLSVRVIYTELAEAKEKEEKNEKKNDIASWWHCR